MVSFLILPHLPACCTFGRLSLYSDLNKAEKQLDMASCTALRTLHLDCRRVREVSPDWTWLMVLLNQLPPASKGRHALRSIVLAFQHSSHALASLHRFAAELDRILSEISWAGSLAEVAFEFDYRFSVYEDEDELALLEAFAGLRSRNLLRGKYPDFAMTLWFFTHRCSCATVA